jgi:hypothetical protein
VLGVLDGGGEGVDGTEGADLGVGGGESVEEGSRGGAMAVAVVMVEDIMLDRA